MDQSTGVPIEKLIGSELTPLSRHYRRKPVSTAGIGPGFRWDCEMIDPANFGTGTLFHSPGRLATTRRGCPTFGLLFFLCSVIDRPSGAAACRQELAGNRPGLFRGQEDRDVQREPTAVALIGEMLGPSPARSRRRPPAIKSADRPRSRGIPRAADGSATTSPSGRWRRVHDR